MDINQAKDIVIKAGKELVARGLIARTWGNVSQRLDEKTMLITPSGRDYLSLTPAVIVPVDIATLEYSGEVKPSSEKAVHASCYRIKNAQFVIHTHQLYASVVSACGIDSFETDKKFNLLGGRVIAAGYGLPGTKKLNENIEIALAQTNGHAVIMKHHGALCFGSSFEETFEAAKQLEDACKVYIEEKFKQVSGEKYADPTAMAKFALALNGILVEQLETRGIELNSNKRENAVINTELEVVALSYLKKPLRPMVDDFAQIVGTKMKDGGDSVDRRTRILKHAGAVFVKGVGAICAGPTQDDAKAVSMILEKNCMAYIGASLHGKVKPINRFESRLMRTVYKMKYSKQINK